MLADRSRWKRRNSGSWGLRFKSEDWMNSILNSMAENQKPSPLNLRGSHWTCTYTDCCRTWTTNLWSSQFSVELLSWFSLQSYLVTPAMLDMAQQLLDWWEKLWSFTSEKSCILVKLELRLVLIPPQKKNIKSVWYDIFSENFGYLEILLSLKMEEYFNLPEIHQIYYTVTV